MEKYVYLITNNVNNKKYIGQSNNPQKRFKQHCNPNAYTSLLNRAINKYGEKNFSLDILYYGENYNEEEKKYIALYNTIDNGYNIQEGGEEPPIKCGDDSAFATFDNNWFKQTVDLIVNTTFEWEEIARMQECNKSTINRINVGKIRKQPEWKYPLRQTQLTNTEVRQIQWLWIHTDLHREEIQEFFFCKLSTIKAIKSGQNHYNSNLEYPLGGSKPKTSLKLYNRIDKIYLDLQNGLNIEAIQKKYKISKLRIEFINDGTIYHNEELSYPLNVNIKKSVETIPLIGE